ncbi:MAG: hypothetical protein F7C34_03785 [Desulfurococcales archaeon]|nr:hypothetical protein [Desulfurococcales archaeon]
MHVYRHAPVPPYRVTPHLERFSLPGQPAPYIYDARAGACRRVLSVLGEPVPVKVFLRGEPDRPAITIHAYNRSPDAAGRARDSVLLALRAGFDYSGLLERVGRWEPLRRLAMKHWGLRPTRKLSLYEALVDAIVKQRIALRASLRLLASLVLSYGGRLTVGGEDYYSAPLPERLARAGVEEIRAHGLTRLKARALVEVAARQLEGSLPTLDQAVRDPEATVRALTRIYGVGRWTAELAVAMVHPRFPLGPLSDLAVSRGLSLVLPGASPRRIVEELGDYAGLVMYLAAYEYESRKKGGVAGGG